MTEFPDVDPAPRNDAPDSPRVIDQLVAAITPHVPFDGWSEAAFRSAIADSGVDRTVARGVCPRGAIDLAVAFHKAGDAAMVARLQASDLSAMKIREKVTAAVRWRLGAVDDKELVRRATTLFALPIHAGEGAGLIWGTADAIWNALGDRSDDVNWYTKRATLAGVYSATVLYWLGDDSGDSARTWAFLDRRIENLMGIEKAKARINGNAFLKPLLKGPNWALGFIKAPKRDPQADLPGSWAGPR